MSGQISVCVFGTIVAGQAQIQIANNQIEETTTLLYTSSVSPVTVNVWTALTSKITNLNQSAHKRKCGKKMTCQIQMRKRKKHSMKGNMRGIGGGVEGEISENTQEATAETGEVV